MINAAAGACRQWVSWIHCGFNWRLSGSVPQVHSAGCYRFLHEFWEVSSPISSAHNYTRPAVGKCNKFEQCYAFITFLPNKAPEIPHIQSFPFSNPASDTRIVLHYDPALKHPSMPYSMPHQWLRSSPWIYRPTLKVTYFNHVKFHPAHVKRSIPYSQFFRLRHLCIESCNFHAMSGKMCQIFGSGGCPKSVFNLGYRMR